MDYLPNEVWNIIALHLSLNSIVSLSIVNKSFHKMINKSDNIWRHIAS